MRFPHSRKRQNHPLQELLKRRHVSYSCFDQVVEATDHHMAFDNFGRLRNSLRKAVKHMRRSVIEPYLDKHDGSTPDLRRFEYSADGPNKAFTEKTLDAL